MHVHGAHLNPNAANLYSALAAEKAAAAKQAAEVRKKLRSGASKIEGEAEADAQAISMIGGGDEEGFPPDHNQKHSPASKKHASEREDGAEEDNSGDPISIWG